MESTSILRRAAAVPTLYTQRLILSRIVPENAQAMYDYAKKRRVTRYLTWKPHKSLAHTREYLEFLQTKYESGEFFDWGVHEKESGHFIGTCGFTALCEENLSGEIGYVFSPQVWGKGYATEAARRVLAFGFEELGLSQISARFLYGNVRSERVMQKLGMISRGFLPEPMHLKGRWRSVLEYRMTSDEYRSIHKQ